MADRRNMSAWERRLKEIEREKAELRTQIRTVERWPDAPQPGTPPSEPRLRDAAIPVGYRGAHPALLRDNPELLEPGTADLPPGEIAVDFAPGPDGLATKRVVMPRLQRTDLLRPATGGAPTAVAMFSHSAPARSAASMTQTKTFGSAMKSGWMIPLRMGPTTSPPAISAPAASKMAARISAEPRVSALEPTAGPTLFATSLAPIFIAM